MNPLRKAGWSLPSFLSYQSSGDPRLFLVSKRSRCDDLTAPYHSSCRLRLIFGALLTSPA
jgi:hypothetical protein